ncbi:MAG TPA: type II toxin-antitoxin system VapC family toxin [Candidatus Hydrogenedentes bacterium]|jgi:hypothetical protein|nr:MAG: hypothetical protein BWY09_02578 [Candidatus Hydrogenedentes bacterium ADurb.Bin179]HOC70318.1 type II toxin-antitoxin system VapC family toxin [Candidatus Hydrogenedentota bacterium]
METVYIETSIVSHATARDRTDPVVSVLQQQARMWWDLECPKFSLVTSQLVLDEASLGDPDAAAERLKLLSGIPLIPTDEQVEAVANELTRRSLIPAKAYLDALHVASAAVGGAQFLLTQNCRHIANAHALPGVYRMLEELGYPGLLIYTPAEFLGNSDDDT